MNIIQSYKILKVEDNHKNGMQAMAVAPIKDGKVDTSEVVIAYAGTNFEDHLDRATDVSTVIQGQENLERSPQHPAPGSAIDGQAITAKHFADQIKKDYPDATITTTGHSLGEYLALMIAAENQWHNIGFNGPDPYNILSPEAKKWIAKHPNDFSNYRNRADKIGNFGGNKTSAAILISMEMGFHANPVDYHQLSVWQFDKDGKLLIPNNDYNQHALIQQAERYVMQVYATEMAGLKKLKAKLQASGGGLSKNEAIYLEDSQARLAVRTASENMAIAFRGLFQLYNHATNDSADRWRECLRCVDQFSSELSEGEVFEEVERVGCTEVTMYQTHAEEYHENMAKICSMQQNFDTLVNEMTASIDKLVEQDQALAKQLQS